MPKLGKIIPSEENANDPFDKLIDLLSGVADALIQTSALDGVPVVGTLIGSVRVWAGWRERIFEEKVRSFIDEAKSAPQDYRDRLAKALGSVAKQRKFGKHLILLLERADDLDKPRLIARVWLRIAAGTMTPTQGMLLMSIIDRALMPDLEYLVTFKDGVQADPAAAHRLAAAGLLDQAGVDGGLMDWSENNGGILFNGGTHTKLIAELLQEAESTR